MAFWQRPLDPRSWLCVRQIVRPRNPPLESTSESLVVIQPRLYELKIYLPYILHTLREQPISEMGTPTMFGVDVLTYPQIDIVVLF